MIVHHLGIIVRDMEKSIQILKKLGYVCIGSIITDYVQKNNIVFLNNADNSLTIELITPIDKTSTVSNSYDGYHHICFDVSDIPDFLINFRLLKIGRIFTKPMIAPALNNRSIVFALLSNGLLVEFITNK